MKTQAMLIVGLGLGLALGLRPSRAENSTTAGGHPLTVSGGIKNPDPKSLEGLLKQGREALTAGEYKAARDAFHDVTAIDMRNVEALHVADDQVKKGRKFQDCEAFYKTYNQKLEAARPGMKRWGSSLHPGRMTRPRFRPSRWMRSKNSLAQIFPRPRRAGRNPAPPCCN